MPDRIPPTSIRLNTAERDLLDAWATYLGHKRARPVSRTEVVATLLRRAAPPKELGPEARAVRQASLNAVKLDP